VKNFLGWKSKKKYGIKILWMKIQEKLLNKIFAGWNLWNIAK
jgi:hypothetical protein